MMLERFAEFSVVATQDGNDRSPQSVCVRVVEIMHHAEAAKVPEPVPLLCYAGAMMCAGAPLFLPVGGVLAGATLPGFLPWQQQQNTFFMISIETKNSGKKVITKTAHSSEVNLLAIG